MTFSCIEDYLKFIYKEAFLTAVRPMTLARYDVPFVQSVFTDIHAGQKMTEKQLTLAKLIVMKYSKQLSKRGVKVDPVSVEKTSLGVRDITYEKSVLLDDSIKVKFPYNETLISMFREHAKVSQGYVRWSKENKQWELAPTEINILWVSLLRQHGFDVDQAINKLTNDIVELGNIHPNFLTLVKKNGKYIVEDAPPQLEDELQQFSGDVLKLADASTTYGYEISQGVKTQLYEDYSYYGDTFTNCVVSRRTEISPDQLDTAFLYAKRLNRFPLIVIGETFTESYLKSMFNEFTISKLTPTDGKGIYKDKCFLVSRDPDETTPVRLLISTVSMLVGVYGRQLMQDAEKIIWACPRLMHERM